MVSFCDENNEKKHGAKERQEKKFPHFANLFKSTIGSPPGFFYKSLNTEEKHLAYCCVIFDSGSQRTHCTKALKDPLTWKPICTD